MFRNGGIAADIRHNAYKQGQKEQKIKQSSNEPQEADSSERQGSGNSLSSFSPKENYPSPKLDLNNIQKQIKKKASKQYTLYKFIQTMQLQNKERRIAK